MSGLHVKHAQRCMTLVDLLHERLVCWVVKSEEGSIVNADTVGPEMHGAADPREGGGAWTTTGDRSSGVRNDTRWRIVASEGLGAATEVAGP